MLPFLFLDIHHALSLIIPLLYLLLSLSLLQLQLDIYPLILFNILIIGSKVNRLSFLISEFDNLLCSIALPESSHPIVDEVLIRVDLEVHNFLH